MGSEMCIRDSGKLRRYSAEGISFFGLEEADGTLFTFNDLTGSRAVSYTHLTLPTIYSV